MQKFETVLKQLQNSINSLKIDFELVQILRQTLDTLKLDKDTFLIFVKLMTEVYELSNNDKLYQIKRTSISINEMAIELKILVCKMMTLIIVYFEKQQSLAQIPFEILAETIEIMIICARVCLNQVNNKYISFIQDFYKFIHSPYELVSTNLRKNIKFLHQINVLELMRYRCENQSFSIVEFKKRLSHVATFEEYDQNDYKSFVENIVMEILLKSIKNGKLKPDTIKQFYPYLSQESQKDLNCLIFDPENSMKNVETGSEFLQIYKQIKQNGIENINIEFLEDFIKNQRNFSDNRLFEIAALTLQPIILDIWFCVLNSKKEKSPIIQKALMCYIHVVDSILYNNLSHKKPNLEKILKLSNSVAFAMLTEKKSSFASQPALHIIKTFVKVLTWLCFQLHDKWEDIKDFGERTVLLCSRYQCMEIAKIIYAVMLYYCLINKIKAEDIYEKFAAHHSNEKSSEIYKFLSCAYQVQNSGVQGLGDLKVEQTLKTQMRKQPFVAILFAKKNQDMTIFEIEPNQFKEVSQKFYIYSEMLKKYRANQINIGKILRHLEEFLIRTNIQEFQAFMQLSRQENVSIQELFLILIQLLEQKNPRAKNIDPNQKQPIDSKTETSSQICFILINLSILGNQTIANELKEAGSGVLLNKYSSKIKMITGLIQILKEDKISLQPEIYNICCSYLITVLQKFKKLTILKERIAQPGQISFVHAIEQLIQVYHQTGGSKNQQNQIEIDVIPGSSKAKKQSESPEINQMKRNFINFTVFEIDCITNNSDKYFKFVEKLPLEILKNFTHSVYAPKNLKQKIFRRILRQNFIDAKCDLSLKEFKEIIQITDEAEEVKLYMRYVFSAFGQEGRKMIMLMANENKRIQKILLSDKDVEI